MKIQSKLDFNTSVISRHKIVDPESELVVIGGLVPDYLNIPAGATVELPDEEWKKFADSAEGMIENGDLVLLVAPKLSKSEADKIHAKKISDARAIIAAEEKAAKKKSAAEKAAEKADK